MIRYFNTGYISRYLVVFAIAILLWLPSILYPSPYVGRETYAFNFFTYLSISNPLFFTIISMVFTLITAFMLNLYSIKFNLSGKVNTLVWALYILISSAVVGGFHNNPITITNIIMVFVWMNLMNLPQSTNKIITIYNSSFLIGLAALLFPVLIFLVLLVWLTIFVHRVMNLIFLVVSLVGIATPFFFIMVWFFFTGNLHEQLFNLISYFKISTEIPIFDNVLNITSIAIITILTLMSVFGVLAMLSEQNINTRRNLLIVVLFFVINTAILVVFNTNIEFLLTLLIPIVLLITYWLNQVRRPKVYNIILTILLLLILVNQYYTRLPNFIP